MGLAASQACLDLLTLRKSDLEYQIMQIADRRLQLTKDMEVLAEEKARALGNKKIVVINQDENGNNIETIISIENLEAQNRVLMQYDEEKKDWVVVTDKTLKDSEIEEGLRNGTYRLAEGNTTDGATENEDNTNFEGKNNDKYKYIDWRTDSEVRDIYNTSDDEIATAVYDAETAKIKTKDQEFDMQQKTAETQQKAVTGEIDGVKKNIEKSIELGFKLFA